MKTLKWTVVLISVLVFVPLFLSRSLWCDDVDGLIVATPLTSSPRLWGFWSARTPNWEESALATRSVSDWETTRSQVICGTAYTLKRTSARSYLSIENKTTYTLFCSINGTMHDGKIDETSSTIQTTPSLNQFVLHPYTSGLTYGKAFSVDTDLWVSWPVRNVVVYVSNASATTDWATSTTAELSITSSSLNGVFITGR